MRPGFVLVATIAISCGSPRRAPSPSRPAAATSATDAPIVVHEGGCTIKVGAIVSFDVFRGGYRSEDWIETLPAARRPQAEGEDEFEAHGRCVLDVHVGDQHRSYLHVMGGFFIQVPQPTRDQCLAARAAVGEHLMTMTEHCAAPDGRGSLAPPIP